MSGINNLKPFKKGDDPRRNVAGRPKTVPGLEKVLIEVLGGEVNKRSKVHQIIDKLAKLAISGDVRAAQLLLDRVYGKALETVRMKADVTTNGESLNGRIDASKLSTETLREILAAAREN